jgi:hypothetical protein
MVIGMADDIQALETSHTLETPGAPGATGTPGTAPDPWATDSSEPGQGWVNPLAELSEAYGHLIWLREWIGRFDVDAWSGGTADEHLRFCSKLGRLGTAGEMVIATKIESGFQWRQEGHRSAASFLAEKMGTTEGAASGVLETARQLAELPETAQCLQRGEFSLAQVTAIARAATVHPGAEGELIEAAARTSLKGLKTLCDRTRALASWENDERGRERAINDSRFLRRYRDADGAVRFEARVTPADGARIWEALRSKAEVLMDNGRRAGSTEPLTRFLADALVGLADDAVCGRGTGIGRPSVVLRVDAASLRRGETEGDEVCEIPGTGPVSLAKARRLLGDCFLKIVIRDGVDITNVSHPGRTLPAHLETALNERDQTCVVPGCDNDLFLQVHHRVSVFDHGITSLANLVRICTWHHDQITYKGWRIEGGPDRWSWEPPPEFDELE